MIPLPVVQLRTKADAFRCLPYAATMTAGSCLIRQANARRQYDRAAPSEMRGSKCIDCSLGGEVERQLVTGTAAPSIETSKPEVLTEKTMAKCRFKGCNDDAAAARKALPGLEAFCGKHRQHVRTVRSIATEYGFDFENVRFPSNTAKPVVATPAETKIVDDAIKSAKKVRAARVVAVKPAIVEVTPARFSLHLQIDGETVAFERLVELYRAVRGATR